MEVDDALVGAAAEEQIRVPLLEDEGPVDEYVEPGEQLRELRIGLDLLDGKSGPAPDGFRRFRFDAPGEFGEGFRLVERVAAGETDVGEFVGLDDAEQLFHLHPFPGVEVPGLGIVAALAGMAAAGTVNGRTETGSVGHCLLDDI